MALYAMVSGPSHFVFAVGNASEEGEGEGVGVVGGIWSVLIGRLVCW